MKTCWKQAETEDSVLIELDTDDTVEISPPEAENNAGEDIELSPTLQLIMHSDEKPSPNLNMKQLSDIEIITTAFGSNSQLRYGRVESTPSAIQY